MPTHRMIRGFLLAGCLLGLAGLPVARGQEASASLRQAVELFENGDYLASQRALTSIDRNQLSPDEQKTRDDYLNRVQVAQTMYEKALRDLEDAETAISGGENARARMMLQRVLDNEYAAQSLRNAASAHLRDLPAADTKGAGGDAQARIELAQTPTETTAPATRTETRVAERTQPAPAPSQPEPMVVTTMDVAPAQQPSSGQSQPMTMAANSQPAPTTPSDTVPMSDPTPMDVQASNGATQVTVSSPSTAPVQQVTYTPSPTVNPADAERARSLVAEASGLVRVAQYEEAAAKYEEALRLVPGHPDAVDGLVTVRQHQRQASSTGDSLAQRIQREDEINWQRAVVQYRDVERQIQENVRAEKFDAAMQLLARARQLVESGKQFADPVSKYDSLKAEYEALALQVKSDERSYHETKVAETRRDIEAQRAERIRTVEENRQRQVAVLMEQAQELRKEGDIDGAINALKQVTVIDPKYNEARWMMDLLEDKRQYQHSRELRDQFYKKTRGALEDVEEAKIPWHEEVTFAKDWPEIISRAGRSKPGQSREDKLLLSALDRPVTVDFLQTPFNEVVQQLAKSQNVNIIVNWNDLARAGVKRDVPIDLSLPREISLKKVLTEALEQAGGGNTDLGFEISENAVNIGTQQALDRETVTKVYDISDLLMEVPHFTDAPMVDLRQATPKPKKVSEDQAIPWKYGDDDDDEEEMNPDHDARVKKIIELLEDTVDPDSWRSRGGSVGQIKEINGQLVVTQNAAAQRQIVGLLDRLREERSIQVAVEALFITVSSHYLEEMGIDIDIILNAGNAGYDFLSSGAGPVTDPVLGNRLLLPRTFSQLGVTPNSPAIGTPLVPGAVPQQPYTQPYLVPPNVGGGGSRITPVPVLSGATDLTNTANLPSDVPGSFAGQTIAPALSIFGSFLDNIQVDFLIRATQADSRTSVLTAPRLVVFNGGSAWIAVTIQQNFISSLQPVVAQQAVAQAPVTGTVDAGASLFVRATVTADKRYVMMILAPGVTRLLDLQTFQFSGGTGALQAFVQLPTLSSQRIQTMVSVPDGGTLLLGGQKLASETEVEAGVPILSKIPVLKRLYSSRSMVKDEQILLILIKPKILIHSEQEELAFPSFQQR